MPGRSLILMRFGKFFQFYSSEGDTKDLEQKKSESQLKLNNLFREISSNSNQVQILDEYHLATMDEKIVNEALNNLKKAVIDELSDIDKKQHIANSLVKLVNSFGQPEELKKAYCECIELCNSLKERFPKTTAALYVTGGLLAAASIASFIFLIGVSPLLFGGSGALALVGAIAFIGAVCGMLTGVGFIEKAMEHGGGKDTDLSIAYLGVAKNVNLNFHGMSWHKHEDNTRRTGEFKFNFHIPGVEKRVREDTTSQSSEPGSPSCESLQDQHPLIPSNTL